MQVIKPYIRRFELQSSRRKVSKLPAIFTNTTGQSDTDGLKTTYWKSVLQREQNIHTGALHYNTAVPTPLCSLVKLSSSFHMGYFKHTNFSHQGFPGGSDAKESSCNEGDPDSIPGLGRSPGEGNVYPLQCSCLENSTEEPGRLQSIRSQRARRD